MAARMADTLAEGDRVRLTQDVDRYPHFIASAGRFGVVQEATENLVCVRMDEHLDGAEEWDNEVCWTADHTPLGAERPDARIAAADALLRLA